MGQGQEMLPIQVATQNVLFLNFCSRSPRCCPTRQAKDVVVTSPREDLGRRRQPNRCPSVTSLKPNCVRKVCLNCLLIGWRWIAVTLRGDNVKVLLSGRVAQILRGTAQLVASAALLILATRCLRLALIFKLQRLRSKERRETMIQQTQFC
jgi:hypothetical protein